ncbi:ATPase [Planctomyces sp. SCGC AG-212-M04]|nr:ATPase [Planctomyces sp. SCGC AG-212-M04]
MNSTTPAANEVHIVRTINAPRGKVFATWTSQQSLERWFAPHGCSIEFRRFKAEAGGDYLSCIRSPEGHECWCTGSYEVFSPPGKLVMTMSNCDQDGNLVRPTDLGMDPDWPGTTCLTVTFEDVGGSTRITLHQTVDESVAKRTGAYPSWLQMFDRLAESLA